MVSVPAVVSAVSVVVVVFVMGGVTGAVSDVGVASASVEGVPVGASGVAMPSVWRDVADIGVVMACAEMEDAGVIEGFSGGIMTG